MRAQAIDSLAAWPADLTPPGGVLVLTGYGLDVRVWRGRLRVADGIGRDRREAIVHRATGRLRRLVVLGHSGSISLEAIRWLADVGAGFLQIDADGRVLAAFGPPGTDRPGLRRAQARALDTPLGVDLARRLIAQKIAAQSETLASVGEADVTARTLATILEAVTRLHVAATRDDVRMAEAMAAAVYWSELSSASVRFAARDEGSVPAHWRTVGVRSSPLTGSPRLASNPANAILNYLYAILEAEATIAARVVGLDPGLGVLHADQLNRDSLSTDLMEPVRPIVDRYVFDLLAERRFAAADFFETRQGVCRVTPQLARELAEAALDWGRVVGRVAEDVARRLEASGNARPMPTPVSGRNRSAGRQTQTRPDRTDRRPAALARSCRQCGSPVERSQVTGPGPCTDDARSQRLATFAAAGRRRAAELRSAGTTPDAVRSFERMRIGERNSDLVAAARAWQATHQWPAPGTFERDVRPRLEGVSAAAIARATGLSRGYCQLIKRGEAVPHPMWWETLQTLVT